MQLRRTLDVLEEILSMMLHVHGHERPHLYESIRRLSYDLLVYNVAYHGSSLHIAERIHDLLYHVRQLAGLAADGLDLKHHLSEAQEALNHLRSPLCFDREPF